MFTETVLRGLQGGSKLYVFRFAEGGEEFEIVTTRDIALSFAHGDLSLVMVYDY